MRFLNRIEIRIVVVKIYYIHLQNCLHKVSFEVWAHTVLDREFQGLSNNHLDLT